MTLENLKDKFRMELRERYSQDDCDLLSFIFIEKILDIPPLQQRLQRNEKVSEIEFDNFEFIINELKTGKPYQQILGETEFFGLSFLVDENVLIPRPETEELIELAFEKMLKKYSKNDKLKILDIGTGSGIIPIVVKKFFPNAEVFALDVSEKAIEIAKKNANYHQVEIHFFQMNYLQEELGGNWDVIFSNPPYIGINEKKEIAITVQDFEPNIALFSPTNDSLIFYRKIAIDALECLNENGMIFLEINQKLGQETLCLFQNFKYSMLYKDISGNDRMIFVEK
ncbi:MAG: peptide chain release factor N(5)-glutamine methyltransferase [Bacteroidetes bacterium]|nr:peptide chain release factor N(5)-glutamine methyltransferase [Bacteroidota bacterium]